MPSVFSQYLEKARPSFRATISEYIYDLSFNYVPNYGYAAAVSYVVLVIIVLITIVQKKVTGDHDE